MRPALGLSAIALTLSITAAADTKSDPKLALSEQATLLAPIQVDSVTITPIVATATGMPKQDPELLVLDEGMASKQVRITEFDEGNVNSLTFRNDADRPVFLLAGEVILGGKQDRIIGKNTVIPAKTTQEVPVFCVEHGRWDNSSKSFATANALAHGRLRYQASYESQQDVWNEVARKNELRKTKSSTDTYRKVATQQSDGTLAKREKAIEAALAKLPAEDRNRMIGYAVALNGKVATVDMFASPKLFNKLQKKLVKSYLTEAIDIAAAKDAKPPTATQVKTFMADVDKAAEQESYKTKAASTKMKKAPHAAKASVDFADERVEGAPAAAAPVYQNYQAK
ncbi:MAG TPA: DUF6569 family protein [Kofleriaceae bacterium]|nr:DUF6569 family protein [Kofleriaceae bacterium]